MKTKTTKVQKAKGAALEGLMEIKIDKGRTYFWFYNSLAISNEKDLGLRYPSHISFDDEMAGPTTMQGGAEFNHHVHLITSLGRERVYRDDEDGGEKNRTRRDSPGIQYQVPHDIRHYTETTLLGDLEGDRPPTDDAGGDANSGRVDVFRGWGARGVGRQRGGQGQLWEALPGGKGMSEDGPEMKKKYREEATWGKG
ncbi:hypothetical protein BJ165DRAFT_1407888 [Panaeolus papilionaceus]|nr:hypothetical protein BJ165DRAFT_1407888 [Panaeolus papilionaceus]